MDKMMTSKEQDRKKLSEALDHWFERNFGDITVDDPLYPKLLAAKDDARHVFGLNTLIKGD